MVGSSTHPSASNFLQHVNNKKEIIADLLYCYQIPQKIGLLIIGTVNVSQVSFDNQPSISWSIKNY